MFKSYPLCDWVRFVEAYGQPLRLGKYDKSSTSEDRTVLFRAVRRIGVDIAAKVPEEMNIEFPGESTVQGRSELYKDLVTYIEYQVSIAVLGQLLYAFSPARPGGEMAKVVIRLTFSSRVRGEDGRDTVVANAFRTAGYVDAHNLREPRHQVLEGAVG